MYKKIHINKGEIMAIVGLNKIPIEKIIGLKMLNGEKSRRNDK